MFESDCVPRVVQTKPEVHVKLNVTSQWVNPSVLNDNFQYLEHVKTALGMLASQILGQ